MARIRIVDEWRRSPVSAPIRYRSILVVAETWAEQRVLMRAFAGSIDQTRPTISLHGEELAIGPAGVDPHGPWGVHVEPPADGRAQELRGQLELAARRLAGSKGNPPRLEDEVPAFERKATNQWAPGTPRDTPGRDPGLSYEPEIPASQSAMPAAMPPQAATPVVAPAPVSSVSPASASQSVPAFVAQPRSTPLVAQKAPALASSPTPELVSGPSMVGTPQSSPDARTMAPQSAPALSWARRQSPAPQGHNGAPPAQIGPPAGHPSRVRRSTRHPMRKTGVGGKTVGFGSHQRSASPPRSTKNPPSLAKMVGKTMPLGFRLADSERTILNALGRAPLLTATEVSEITGESDGVAFMERLIGKLSSHRLDLVLPGDPVDGQPTYRLRRA